MVDDILKQDLMDFTTTSAVYKTFREVKTHAILKYPNLLILKLITVQSLRISQYIQTYYNLNRVATSY